MRLFRKNVDIKPIYNMCIEDATGFRLSAA